MLRSRQLDKKPIDLHAVINESLALVAHDLRARQIKATVDLSSNPCVISGDQVLLQQVLVNLVMNAIDAMAETPPARREVTIRTEVRAADVEVSLGDTGTVCRRILWVYARMVAPAPCGIPAIFSSRTPSS